MRSSIGRTCAFCIGLGLSAVIAEAQTAPAAPRAPQIPQTFGTASAVSHTIQAYEFQPFNASYAGFLQGNVNFSRYCTTACFLEAPLFLPAGALLTSLELDVCDLDTADLQVNLFRIGISESAKVTLATATTTGVPGCAVLTATPTAHTIDNAANSYVIEVNMGGSAGLARFQAVRVLYKLQASPAPATATFGDVPVGHPQHRFVEALVAAGITAGCGSGNFCPTSPVTRGQMAVFLSVALGLHWVP